MWNNLTPAYINLIWYTSAVPVDQKLVQSDARLFKSIYRQG
jgi:hypothetical protein